MSDAAPSRCLWGHFEFCEVCCPTPTGADRERWKKAFANRGHEATIRLDTDRDPFAAAAENLCTAWWAAHEHAVKFWMARGVEVGSFERPVGAPTQERPARLLGKDGSVLAIFFIESDETTIITVRSELRPDRGWPRTAEASR